MVAISLYKGNLHRLPPDVPRRWAVPTPTISIKQFKALIQRRSRALSRLQSSNPNNPNPNPNNNNNNNHSSIPTNDDDTNCNETQLEDLNEKEDVRVVEQGEELVEEDKADAELAVDKKEEDVNDVENNAVAEPKPEALKSNTENATSDKEQRIKEVKEKLEVLNEKKHSLVQVLKQILNVEEQLKRQHSTQGMSARPPLPLQVDTTTDSGSMTRVNTPRIGSDGNPCGDTDVGEPDDGSNHNHSRQLPLMSSTSPSSYSQQRKPASTMVPHSYRTTIGVAGSPSRFAPAGQVHSSVSVSVSGTSYIASSPSPAASGGTSVFRDARLPSPWN